MSKLKVFSDLKEKERLFKSSKYYQIDTKTDFDSWFNELIQMKLEERTNFIFRGMKDARHRLYTSGQRIWLENDMEDWAGRSYIEFINRLVQNAKQHPLIEKVFDVYDYTDIEREFPILSILQHYGAPTPLMDWTYNINVALFFATETLVGGHGTGEIENYFSIYAIDKRDYRQELLNLKDFSSDLMPSILGFEDWSDSRTNSNKNGVFYISDFDDGNVHLSHQHSTIKLRTSKPITSVYNQNIIPQEGLFIFNPFSSKSIEEVFNIEKYSEGSNLVLPPFTCINIKKDLADYVRRRIKEHSDIDNTFIYPHLYDDAKFILNKTLNSFV